MSDTRSRGGRSRRRSEPAKRKTLLKRLKDLQALLGVIAGVLGALIAVVTNLGGVFDAAANTRVKIEPPPPQSQPTPPKTVPATAEPPQTSTKAPRCAQVLTVGPSAELAPPPTADTPEAKVEVTAPKTCDLLVRVEAQAYATDKPRYPLSSLELEVLQDGAPLNTDPCTIKVPQYYNRVGMTAVCTGTAIIPANATVAFTLKAAIKGGKRVPGTLTLTK